MTVALGCHVNGTSRKRVEIKRTDYRKTKTTSKWKFVSILVFSCSYILYESEKSEGSTILVWIFDDVMWNQNLTPQIISESIHVQCMDKKNSAKQCLRANYVSIIKFFASSRLFVSLTLSRNKNMTFDHNL